MIALLEGAFMLGRAHRRTDPVPAAATAAQAIVSAALAVSAATASHGVVENGTI